MDSDKLMKTNSLMKFYCGISNRKNKKITYIRQENDLFDHAQVCIVQTLRV